jgi:hypothetical protein
VLDYLAMGAAAGTGHPALATDRNLSSDDVASNRNIAELLG